MTDLEYYNKIAELIQLGAPVDKFKTLYREHFNREPDKNLIDNYLTNISQKQSYDEYDSYDDSYDSSY